jgi:hypothetical protein
MSLVYGYCARSACNLMGTPGQCTGVMFLGRCTPCHGDGLESSTDRWSFAVGLESRCGQWPSVARGFAAFIPLVPPLLPIATHCLGMDTTALVPPGLRPSGGDRLAGDSGFVKSDFTGHGRMPLWW